MRAFALVLTLVAGSAAAFAHEGIEHHGCDPTATFTAGDVTVSGAFTRAMLPGAPTAGGYMTITSHGSGDRLVVARSEAAGAVELHEMKMDGAMMTMAPLPDGLAIPAGGSVTLSPDGLHLMFTDVHTPFKEGECVEATLTFEHAGELPVVFSIGGIAADAPPHGH